MMFDNDQQPLTERQQNNNQQQMSTPFHFSKQYHQSSISDIVPDSHRSYSNTNHMMRNSLDNIYGFVMGTHHGAGEGGANGILSLQQSARSHYYPQHSKQLTAMINPVNNTTEFYTEEDENHQYEHDDCGFDAQQMQQQAAIQQRLQHLMNMPRQYLQQREEECNFVDAMAMNQQQFEEQEEEGQLSLVVWGRNQMGQLGLDPHQNAVIKNPITVPRVFRQNCDIKQVACGKAHTMLLLETTGGTYLYALGSNKTGQLGIGRNASMVTEPTLVDSIQHITISKIVCSKNSTLALTEGGSLYSWGSSKDGVLGIGSTKEDQFNPMKVTQFGDDGEVTTVLDVSAGKSHAAAIVRRADQENLLYLWGSNRYGQLGLGAAEYDSKNVPCEVAIKQDISQGSGNESSDMLTVSIREQQPVAVICGDSFTIVQTQTGHLYTCGSNIQGQLGLGSSLQSNKVNTLMKVKLSLGEDGIQKIVASDFVACLCRNGDLFLWGPTPVGQFSEPKSLVDIANCRIYAKEISIGTSFGLIQDTRSQCYQLGSLFHENMKQHYDSSLTNQQQIQMSNNLQPLKGCPIKFEQFACGHDFVVAVTTQNVDSSRGINTSVRKSGNQSRSANNYMNRGKQYPFNDSSIEGAAFKNAVAGRYAQGNGRDIPQSSVCSSSLSPLRCSVTGLTQLENQTQHSRRNDVLNRSANLINGSAMKSGNQNSNNLAQLKILRDSCTPVREFAPNTTTASKAPTVQVSCEQSFQQHTPIQPQIVDQLGDAHFNTSHYSTMQDERTVIQQFNLPVSQNSQTPQHNPSNSVTSQSQVQPSQAQKVPPFNINSQTIPTPFSHINDSSYHLAASLDIIIREKQELQHSLNIEIQKRLMAEREMEQSYAVIVGTSAQELEQVQLALEQAQNEALHAKSELQQAFSDHSNEIATYKTQTDILTSKVEDLMSEIESLKAQIATLSDQSQLQLKKETSSIEENISKKNKEIYELTVQLGCLKEENHQLTKDKDDMKIDFEERLVSQQIRAEADYTQLQEECTSYQNQCSADAMEIELLKQSNQAQQTLIKELEEKISQMTIPKKSAKLSVRGSIENALNYSSQGAEIKRPQSHEHSFQSVNSKKGNTKQAKKEPTKSNIIESKENIEAPMVLAPLLEKDAPLEGTQRLFNPIETPNESQKQTLSSLAKSKHQPPSHRNLFKKIQPQAVQPVLLSQTTPNPTTTEGSINARPGSNRDQGCLQGPSYSQIQRKKSQTGTTLTVANQVSSKQVSANNTGVLKVNNNKVNQQNALQTLTQQVPVKKHNISTTPTRNIPASSRLTQQENCQASQSFKPSNKHSNCISKSPTPQQASYNSNTQTKKQYVSKQKSISNPPINNTSNCFQLANNEGESIFDLSQQPRLDENNKVIKRRRASQQHNFVSRAATHNQHEVTLGGSGGIQNDSQEAYADNQVKKQQHSGRTKSSPSTPQIPCTFEPHHAMMQQQIRSQDFTTAQSFVVIESCTHNSTPKAALKADQKSGRGQAQQAKEMAQKNPSLSSSSTSGVCGQIMSEMRNKLIDIQNNKQYIEQKIQEYEKKLQQLKGGPTGSQTSSFATSSHQHNFNANQQYYDLPRQGGNNSNNGGTFGSGNGAYFGGQQMTKSSSGLLLLNNHNPTSRRGH